MYIAKNIGSYFWGSDGARFRCCHEVQGHEAAIIVIALHSFLITGSNEADRML